jgi:hypothetical protein
MYQLVDHGLRPMLATGIKLRGISGGSANKKGRRVSPTAHLRTSRREGRVVIGQTEAVVTSMLRRSSLSSSAAALRQRDRASKGWGVIRVAISIAFGACHVHQPGGR